MLRISFLFLLCTFVGKCDVDDDGDGFADNQGDCDDADARIFSGIVLNSTTGITYTDLVKAASEVRDGETLKVCGTFAGPVGLSGKNNITISGYSAFQSSVTGQGFIVEGATGILIENLLVTGCVAGDQTDQKGGGFWIKDSEVIIQNGAISDNYAGAMGGGMYINTSGDTATVAANVVLTDVSLVGNDSGDHGGGIYVRGDSLVAMTGGSVQDTISHHGVYLRDTDGNPEFQFTEVLLENNTANDVEFDSGASFKWDTTVTYTCTGGACN